MPNEPLGVPVVEPVLSKRAQFIRRLAQREDAAAVWLPRQMYDGGHAPATLAQLRLWIHHQTDQDTAVQNLAIVVAFESIVEAPWIERCLRSVLSRHDAFRTRFIHDGDHLYQVADCEIDPTIVVEDLRSYEPADAAHRLDETVWRAVSTPFRLDCAPLYRSVLVLLPGDRSLLVFVTHHILCDAWSSAILCSEFLQTWSERAPSSQQRPGLHDYARHEAQVVSTHIVERNLAYWRERLAAPLPVLALPLDKPRRSLKLERAGWLSQILGPDELQKITSACGRHSVTVQMLVLACYVLLLSRYANQYDIVIGTDFAGRDDVRFDATVGFFVDTLPLRFHVGDNLTLRGFLEHVRDRVIEAIAHRPLVFHRLVAELKPARTEHLAPVFQTAFSIVEERRREDDCKDAGSPRIDLVHQQWRIAEHDLSFFADVSTDRMEIAFEYRSSLFEPSTIARFAQHFRNLLDAFAGAEDQPLREVNCLSTVERRTILEHWNDTAEMVMLPLALPTAFQEHARLKPEAAAVTFDDDIVTYAQLAERTAALASDLVGAGAGPERLVAILADRDPWFVATVLGVFSAAGAYVPFSPSEPESRLRMMLRQVAPAALACTQRTEALARRLASSVDPSLSLVVVDRQATAGGPPHDTTAVPRPASLAYEIFTSGSTGVPKAAMVCYRGMINHLHAKNATLGLTSSDVVAQSAPQTFDVHVWQMLCPLSVGARMAILPDDVAMDARRLIEAVADQRITVLEVVPTVMRAILDEFDAGRCRPDQLTTLRWLICNGETLGADLCARWLAVCPDTPLINAYGPTECSDDVAQFRVTAAAADGRAAPIGRPLANTRIYIVDRSDQPVPIGVVGELLIGGDGVGRGYDGDPATTAARFIPDPFGGDAGARLYRTGDLARFLADGTIEFVGRVDHQIKIRGCRVEIGEIEAALMRHAGVNAAIVVAHRNPAAEHQLTAFVTPRGDLELSSGELQAHVQSLLPREMVPSNIAITPSLPLLANGKINRIELSTQAFQMAATPLSLARLEGPVDELVGLVFADVLRLQAVGRDQDFFSLGGHSLTAAVAATRLREILNTDVRVRDIFDHPTPALLSGRIRRSRGGRPWDDVPRITRRAEGTAHLASAAQRRVWIADQLRPQDHAYHMAGLMRICGSVQIEHLQQALDAVVARHQSLRTVFVERCGILHTDVVPASPVELPVIDLRERYAERPSLEVEWAQELARPGFRLDRWPLFRVALLRFCEEEYSLALAAHHIAYDGWSMSIFADELATLHANSAFGQSQPLAPLPIQYSDFAAWEQDWLGSRAADMQRRYWRKTLGDLPNPDILPADGERSGRGARAERFVSSDVTCRIKRVARQEGASVLMVLLAGLKAHLFALSGRTDIIVATLSSGRCQTELERLIGFFVNVVAIRTELSGCRIFTDAIAAVRRSVLDAFDHRELPYDIVVSEVVQPHNRKGHHPFQIVLTYNALPTPLESRWDIEIEEVFNQATRFDLEFLVQENDNGLKIVALHDAELFSPEHVASLLAGYVATLDAFSSAPERPLRVAPAAPFGMFAFECHDQATPTGKGDR